MMKTLADRIRVGGAVTLAVLGVIVLYQGGEIGLFIGIASIAAGVGFLWHIIKK